MQLAPGVYSLGVAKGFESHAFLIEDGGELTLIDTLFDADARVILNQIRAIGRSPTDLKHIVLTHAHRSHLGGLATLKQMSGATVYSHAWEADIIAGERAAQQVSWRPQDPLVTYHFQVANNLNLSKHRPCAVDQSVEDGDTIGSGDASGLGDAAGPGNISGPGDTSEPGDSIGPLVVIHAPGHTPGHLAFWLAKPRILFCGDAVVTSPKFMAGWPGFVINKRQHIASLQKLARYDAAILAFGHGEPILQDGAARLRGLIAAV